MPQDAYTLRYLCGELDKIFCGGKINRIVQPSADEVVFTVYNGKTTKLLVDVNPAAPRIGVTEKEKESPLTAPNFCMLLRKHISGGRIVDVWQPKLERIIHFTVEHLDELGDLCRKDLIVEIMGKHSNIIFCTEDGRIIDSIKHVSAQMSSVREVLPGREYFGKFVGPYISERENGS